MRSDRQDYVSFSNNDEQIDHGTHLWFMLRHAVLLLELLCNGPCAHELPCESVTDMKKGNPWD